MSHRLASKTQLKIDAVKFVGGVIVFVLAAGLTEFSIGLNGVTVQDSDGDLRRMTWIEMSGNGWRAGVESFPYALIASVIFEIVTWVCFGWLRKLPEPTAILFGLLIGATCGGSLSIAIWTALGGWGPPFLIPAIATGSIITASVGGALPRLCLE